MAADLRVTGAELQALAGRMDVVAARLDNEVSGCKGREQDIGDPGVIEALRAFERHWGDGRTRLRTAAVDLAQLLRDSDESYSQTDADVAAALSAEENLSGPEGGRW